MKISSRNIRLGGQVLTCHNKIMMEYVTSYQEHDIKRWDYFILHNSYPFLLQDLTGSTSALYSLFLSQKVGFTTFCIVIAALTLM